MYIHICTYIYGGDYGVNQNAYIKPIGLYSCLSEFSLVWGRIIIAENQEMHYYLNLSINF